MVNQLSKATHGSTINMMAPVMKQATGKYIAVLSDTSLDRDEEFVGKSALIKIEKDFGYLAGLIDHENKVLNQVCEWVNKSLTEIDGHIVLVAEPKFFESNPNAKIIKGMLDEGAKIGISIGAIVKDFKDTKIENKMHREFTELELLEASFVAIPSNRHGQAMAVAKSFNTKGYVKMSDIDKKFTQTDIDSAILDTNKSFETKVSDLNKQLESKDAKISELNKSIEEKESTNKVVSDKVVELEKTLEVEKKTSLEKQSFIEKLQKDEDDEPSEETEKALKDGKLPMARF